MIFLTYERDNFSSKYGGGEEGEEDGYLKKQNQRNVLIWFQCGTALKPKQLKQGIDIE